MSKIIRRSATAATLAVLLMGASPPPQDVTAGGVTLRSVSVELPVGEAVYTGTDHGADAMTANCGGCHSTEMVLNQPGLTEATWRAEVTKMRNVYKAPVADADVPAIIAYLAKVKGPGSP